MVAWQAGTEYSRSMSRATVPTVLHAYNTAPPSQVDQIFTENDLHGRGELTLADIKRICSHTIDQESTNRILERRQVPHARLKPTTGRLRRPSRRTPRMRCILLCVFAVRCR
jgi:hypothetical protein